MNGETAELARVFRQESGRVLAALIAQLRDFDLAEEAFSDAMIEAARVWPTRGRPDNGGAWLLAVARRRAIDRLRRNKTRSSDQNEATIRLLAEDDDMAETDYTIPDERLRLIFTCCHPALSEEARVALTLRTLCGLTAREIARAFLTSETTMNQRLTRAKAKIRDSGISYRVPETEDIAARLQSVLAVIYLIYNESYSAYEGQSLSRKDLVAEAIRLAEILYHLLPDPEAAGLLALIRLHHARNAARTDETGALISLEDQNRSLWDTATIKKATDFLTQTLKKAQPGPYQIQAAISALHAAAPDWQSTDWSQICMLYAALYRLTQSPVVALNRAVAESQIGDPADVLAKIDALQETLGDYQPLHAARADLLARLDRRASAIAAYDRAIALSKNDAERAFLKNRRAKIA